MREEIIKRGLENVLKAYRKLNESRDLEYTKEIIKITKRLSLELECIRTIPDMDEDFNGTPISYEVYAVKDGTEIDCVTIDAWADAKPEIEYLLNCYV